MDATQVASDIAGGKITAFKAMQNALSKAKEYRNLGAIVKIESEAALAKAKKAAVSYTHLTLPTNREV